MAVITPTLAPEIVFHSNPAAVALCCTQPIKIANLLSAAAGADR